jgi:hypothetical protein
MFNNDYFKFNTFFIGLKFIKFRVCKKVYILTVPITDTVIWHQYAKVNGKMVLKELGKITL